MALGAILPKFIFVNIFMAVCAFPRCNTGEFLQLLSVLNRNLMAQFTVNFGVFAPQRKLCVLMIKFWCGSERFEIMTGCTV